MARRTPAAAMEHANLIVAANASVDTTSREKFTDWLLADVQGPAAQLQGFLGTVASVEGTRQVSQSLYEDALDEGDDLLRDVNGYLKGLPRSVNRNAMKAHYGISRGVGGHFTNAQIISLMRGFLIANGTAPTAAKLRADMLTDIQATLNKIDANRPAASPGERQEEINARDDAWALLEDGISRVWHYLSAALPDGVFDPGLARYGFTPRQKPTPGTTEADTPTEVPANPS